MTSRPLRVAMIGQKGYPPVHGGIEKHVAELACRLPAMGFDVDVYSRPHYSAADGPTDIPGVSVRRLPSVPTKHLDAITHSCLATGHVLLHPPDIVHYHALGPGLLAGLPRWMTRRPTVVTVHGLDWQRDKWGGFARSVLRLGERASAVLPQRTIVVSRALKTHYRERHGCEARYIPNGIVVPEKRAPALIRDLGVTGPFVLFVGRLVPEKGCHLLLEAWRGLPAEVRETFRLVVAGDSGFTEDYVARLRRDATPDAKFVGYVHGPALEELFSNAEVMVLPSSLEGLSIALLEGMSYARCCLVSDIAPNVEAADGNARLFTNGNADSLREELLALLGDESERRRLGTAAAAHATANYSWDRVAAETAALYRELSAASR